MCVENIVTKTSPRICGIINCNCRVSVTNKDRIPLILLMTGSKIGRMYAVYFDIFIVFCFWSFTEFVNQFPKIL